MGIKIFFIGIIFLIVIYAITLNYARFRWEKGTLELRARLEAARAPIQHKIVDFCELDGLPKPVQRFFRHVLKDGAHMVITARVQHKGTFNMGEKKERWKPFTSDQLVIAQRAGFDWNGRISIIPGFSVQVHDAYIAGEGILHAALLGLFPIVDIRGKGDVAEGELMRFFAEAAWYPTALLPSQGVRWEGVDDFSTRGTLHDGQLSVSMLFTFNEHSLIDTVRAEARGRMVSGQVIPTPWLGHFWNYQERAGMVIPLEGEVAWLLNEGPRPYWRGRIIKIVYEFAQ